MFDKNFSRWGFTLQIFIPGFYNRPHQRVYSAPAVPVWSLTRWYSEGVCELHSHRYRITSYNACYSLAFSAFNTARWKPSVSGLPWPGPVHEDRAKYNNFTCFFKVLGNIIITRLLNSSSGFQRVSSSGPEPGSVLGVSKRYGVDVDHCYQVSFHSGVWGISFLMILTLTRTIFSMLCLLLLGSLLSVSLIFLPVSSYRSGDYLYMKVQADYFKWLYHLFSLFLSSFLLSLKYFTKFRLKSTHKNPSFLNDIRCKERTC